MTKPLETEIELDFPFPSMVGWLFGGEAEESKSRDRLQQAKNAVVEGFGPREGRRQQSSKVKAASAFDEAGNDRRRRRRKQTSDAEEAEELRQMFGRAAQPVVHERAWDSTPFRPRPAALVGLLPVTREPWAVSSLPSPALFALNCRA